MIHPLFKWFGSKWSSSKHYPAPVYDRIFEPFAGAAGYSLRHPQKQVHLFDTNPHVTDLWKWLINVATKDLVLQIPIDLPIGYDIGNLDLTYGQKLLLKMWQRTNNLGNCWTTSPWGNKPGQWTKSTRARVSEEVYAVKHWVYSPISFTESGTYFIDPPYQYNYKYAVEFNHKVLAQILDHIPSPSQIIACEAICPKTGTVPNYLPFGFSHSQVTSRRRANNNHHSKELIYIRNT